MGWIGVDLFFVLSGFLISALLFQEFQDTGRISVSRFLVHRGFKIYLSYYALLIVTVAGSRVCHKPFSAHRTLHDLSFVQNYLRGTWAHFWSLAVEEHFYLILPAALWIVGRRRRSDPFSLMPLACGLIAVTCLAMRFAAQSRRAAFDFLAQATPSHLRIDSLTFGVLFSYLWRFRPGAIESIASGNGLALLGVSVTLIMPCFYCPWRAHSCIPLGYTLLYMGFGGLLLYFMRSVRDDARGHGLSRIATYSYSI